MHVEKAADDGTGACAVCWEGLDVGLEEGSEGVPTWQSGPNGAPATAAPAADVNGPAAAPASEGSPAAPPAEEPPLLPRIVVLPCGHAFHSTCLLPWFSQHTTCPNCRFNVDPDGLASTAYLNGRRRAGAGPHMHFNGPPAGLLADLMAHLTSQGLPDQTFPPQQQQPNAPANADAPTPGQNHRITFNIGPFPLVPPALGGPQQQQGGNGGMPMPQYPQFPFSFLPPPAHPPATPQQHAQGQPQPSPTNGNGPRIHHHHHHHHVADGIDTTYDTFEVELDIGVTIPLGSPGTPRTPNAAGGQQQPPTPGGAPFDMFFHFVTPLGDEVPRTPAQHQQPAAGSPQQQQQTPPTNQQPQQGTPPLPRLPTLPSLRDLFNDPVFATGRPAGDRTRRASQTQPSSQRRKWSRPDSQGRTIRQHVEQRERELGLRCDSTSCDVAPTDEDPAPQIPAGVTTKTICLRPTGEKKCEHKFHPQCIVTAARVAAAAAGRDAADASAVSCPICRAEGALTTEEWEEGERALQAALEA
ncbi:hypothetical protein EXIGLDRAFT_725815 [Exidia glandulosa HHB12029]|uniref:RING-type domain-containing protein n=1 Tax=Exidia glandulosa HHB12029 TaxID=1314781 RepID=A0A165QBP8_EXIGL|nr:hypothetical protein EXIGLDRAFT_725815 [Exidia glandulosa HHB12029]